MSLRKELWKITQNGRVETHERLVLELEARHPHSIRVLKSPVPVHLYTCAMFALGISDDAEYVALTKAAPDDVFASTHFLAWLVENGHLRRRQATSPGSLVLYSQDNQIKHIGVADRGKRVRSKWGVGLLYEHGELEVPESYGSNIQYFNGIARDQTIAHYTQYVQENT